MGIETDKINHNNKTGDSFKDIICGHCGIKTTAREVSNYLPQSQANQHWSFFLICPSCNKGSLIVKNRGSKVEVAYPGYLPGKNLKGLPDDIEKAYQEARGCFSINAFTSCELMCRKILMHIAVEKGANTKLSFAKYINHLETEGYITPPIKTWADKIRSNANESTHELIFPDKARAENTFQFTMMLLRIIYEMEHKANELNPSESTPFSPSRNSVLYNSSTLLR